MSKKTKKKAGRAASIAANRQAIEMWRCEYDDGQWPRRAPGWETHAHGGGGFRRQCQARFPATHEGAIQRHIQKCHPIEHQEKMSRIVDKLRGTSKAAQFLRDFEPFVVLPSSATVREYIESRKARQLGILTGIFAGQSLSTFLTTQDEILDSGNKA